MQNAIQRPTLDFTLHQLGCAILNAPVFNIAQTRELTHKILESSKCFGQEVLRC